MMEKDEAAVMKMAENCPEKKGSLNEKETTWSLNEKESDIERLKQRLANNASDS